MTLVTSVNNIAELKLTFIPHDRSHHTPPGGHAECGNPSCADAENRVLEHLVSIQARSKPGPFFYNGSSESDQIRSSKLYLCRIFDGWYLGHFTKQWYGWNFTEWGTSGIELSSIWLVYEVSGLPTKNLNDPNKPLPGPTCNCGCERNGDHQRYSEHCSNCSDDCVIFKL